MSNNVTPETAVALGELARELAADRNVDTTLAAIVDSAARTFPGVCSIARPGRRGIGTGGMSSSG